MNAVPTISNHWPLRVRVQNRRSAEVQARTDAINDNLYEITYKFYDYFRWSPVVDSSFLRDNPRNLRKNGDFRQLPLMISFNSQEGATFINKLARSSFGKMAECVEHEVNPAYLKLS